MGRVLCGRSWHGPNWFWAELSCNPFEHPNYLFKLMAKKIIAILRSKSLLYLIYAYISLSILGGLSEEVDEKILHAAFIPFGDVTDINIPLDYETGTCKVFYIRGFSYFSVVGAKGLLNLGGKGLNH